MTKGNDLLDWSIMGGLALSVIGLVVGAVLSLIDFFNGLSPTE